MQRRHILLGGASLLAAPAIIRSSAAWAAATLDPNRLKTELNPFGGERAASASGLVPAWNGGADWTSGGGDGSFQKPAGWSAGMPAPDLFAGQAPSFVVTQANMAQYQHMLSDGQIQMLNRYGAKGYKFNVYPSARTAAAPQFVVDNTALNVTRVKALPDGLIGGFSGGYLGLPFPILSDDPAVAGVQAIWNHQVRWQPTYNNSTVTEFVVGNGQRILANASQSSAWASYYDPSISLAQYESHPYYYQARLKFVAPANSYGGLFIGAYTSQPSGFPDYAYEYLTGEGRVRQAPDIEYDIPVTEADDVINSDEVNMWAGKMDRYDWKLVGKQEMIVPYNNFAVMNQKIEDVLGLDFLNPDTMRYEVHRTWVVEATLAAGKRHTVPHRRFYLDEDTWIILLADGYDPQGNFWKFSQALPQAHPELPGTILNTGEFTIHNLQTNSYYIDSIFYGDPPPLGSSFTTTAFPRSVLVPQSLANSGGL